MRTDDICIKGSIHFDQTVLLQNLDLNISGGHWTCLLGSSGVGKSTILQLLAGIPIAGEFRGNVQTQYGDDFKQRAAYMAQSDLLLPWLDVLQNVMLGKKLRAESSDIKRARKLIHQVGLSDHAAKYPHQLSGGMRQRVALARTLMEDTSLVLLDEPFCALDAGTRANMQELAYTLLQDKTVLLVTHDPGEATRLADRLYVLYAQHMEKVSLPDTQGTIRVIDDPDIFKIQANLLTKLRRNTPTMYYESV